jgi:hypothetical protein
MRWYGGEHTVRWSAPWWQRLVPEPASTGHGVAAHRLSGQVGAREIGLASGGAQENRPAAGGAQENRPAEGGARESGPAARGAREVRLAAAGSPKTSLVAGVAGGEAVAIHQVGICRNEKRGAS